MLEQEDQNDGELLGLPNSVCYLPHPMYTSSGLTSPSGMLFPPIEYEQEAIFNLEPVATDLSNDESARLTVMSSDDYPTIRV
jgi:hypothetical protein